MTPQDEHVHEFVRDLNRYRHAVREHLLLDVPQVGTDEMERFLDRAESLRRTRIVLQDDFEGLLEDV
jgi:hypothetical protein